MDNETVIDTTIPEDISTCDSCGKATATTDVDHHQEGNDVKWKYCDMCKRAHDTEAYVNTNLRQLMLTHPADADKPEMAGMFRNGQSLDDVVRFIDTNKQPALEAEVVA
jgi:hypothetical protein